MNYRQNRKEDENRLVYDLGNLYDYLAQIQDTRGKHGKQFPIDNY